MTLRSQENTATKLLKITKAATESHTYRFTSLASLLNEEYLESCYSELNKHRASGIDGVSLEEYGSALKENIQKLCERMRKFSYRPQAVRRAGYRKQTVKSAYLKYQRWKIK